MILLQAAIAAGFLLLPAYFVLVIIFMVMISFLNYVLENRFPEVKFEIPMFWSFILPIPVLHFWLEKALEYS